MENFLKFNVSMYIPGKPIFREGLGQEITIVVSSTSFRMKNVL